MLHMDTTLRIPVPARPTNGGRLELSPAKIGSWSAEPKYNGYRDVIEARSFDHFNRHQKPLSIADCFEQATDLLRGESWTLFADWIDAEVLERRHAMARGSLIVLDFIPNAKNRLLKRTARRELLMGLGIPVAPLDPRQWKTNSLYLAPDFPNAMALYAELAQINERYPNFYEGVVCKDNTSRYPISYNDTSRDFPMWVKHRFDQN